MTKDEVLELVREGRVQFYAAYSKPGFQAAYVLDTREVVTAQVRALVTAGIVKCDRRKITRGQAGGIGPVEARA